MIKWYRQTTLLSLVWTLYWKQTWRITNKVLYLIATKYAGGVMDQFYMHTTDEERFASEVLSDQIIEPSADAELDADVDVVEQGLFLDDLT